MSDKLYTYPVIEAFESEDECPFCYLERDAEHRALRYVAGPAATYMEPDVREVTDRTGFCPDHMKKLYDYGNVLGTALMLQTHFAGLLEEFRAETSGLAPEPRRGLFRKKQPQTGENYWHRLGKRVCSCYICEKMDYNMGRYYDTFFHLTKDPEFRAKAEGSKGFCLRHFAALMEREEKSLPEKQRPWFYNVLIPKTGEELERVKKDLDWLIAKHDYRNAGADWGNSRDALPRTMQKLAGIHPADKPYKEE